MRIYQVEAITPEFVQAVMQLIPQLSLRAALPTAEQLQQVVDSSTARLFAAQEQGRMVGMLTLAWYETPTGRRAWIEDVVVDELMRGRGIGRALLHEAMAAAQELRVSSLSLTSAPTRVAARKLYVEEGFEIYNTTVYKYKAQ
ncbi:MAG: GNAT family N-acetyltransferase [Alistipes sp.]